MPARSNFTAFAMPATYLLPCPNCQQPREVDASQCGLTVECGCGTKLNVPTMRGLARLPQGRVAAAPKESPWGAREGMILVGAIVAAIGLGLGLYGYLTPDVTADEFLEDQARLDYACGLLLVVSLQ